MKITLITHTLLSIIFTSVLVSAEVAPPKNPNASNITIYKQGEPPENIKNTRRKWLAILEQMPKEGRLSDFRRLFDNPKSIGVKSLKSLHTETWEIDASFFVIFEIRSEDIGQKNPRLVNKPKLHSYTFIKKLPSMEEILDKSRSTWFKTIQPKAK